MKQRINAQIFHEILDMFRSGISTAHIATATKTDHKLVEQVSAGGLSDEPN